VSSLLIVAFLKSVAYSAGFCEVEGRVPVPVGFIEDEKSVPIIIITINY
jgi:hypothetical protein